MKTAAIILVLAILPLTALAADMDIKQPDLAGSWYPASKDVLSSVLDSYFKEAKAVSVNGDIVAIIAPHAGLMYSGPVAAYSYKAVEGRNYNTVVILGFCHKKNFDGVSVYKDGYFNTPLGGLAVDSQFAADLAARSKNIIFYPEAFKDENSLEMQMLFIKKVLPDARVVPIAFGTSSFSYCEAVADALADLLKNRNDVLLVASTDMSHYHPIDEARKIDLGSAELLKNFAARRIFDKSVTDEQIFCGYMPVATVLLTANKIGAGKIDILQYSNSGNITGDAKSVVGYVSAAIYKSSGSGSKVAEIKLEGKKMLLNDAQQKKLLKIARDTIAAYLKTGHALEIKENDPVLNKEMGAFVTLHKNGELRGCIGNIIGKGPLYLTVRNMAIESATGDPRFSKVKPEEMKDIDIEISVLSELDKIKNADEIELGVHGVLIRKGFNSGVFLPQVAMETGWSKEEFLSCLCTHKAGLLPDAWKTGEADMYVFTAEVFGDKQ
ncbi:MAG: AmmeMemoRadiSam system protein B [Candidatus Omnitrophota bacterium]|nr:AmmeMemoRadiSam system protein B [Candidatus Omnitrophota bacterium]